MWYPSPGPLARATLSRRERALSESFPYLGQPTEGQSALLQLERVQFRRLIPAAAGECRHILHAVE